jgi:glycosyltransferase involved in cell wall biosynthesis
MIGNKRISLVVPCKNEARIIGAFIKRVPKYVDEILIINNNSTDGTVAEARRAGARVIRERREINGIGYGYAHQTGAIKATGDYVIAMDGDDTYPVRSIKTIIKYMETYSLDMVFCNRLPLTNKKAISWIRRLGIHLLNWEVLLLYGKHVHDILTGMWVARRDTLAELTVTSGDWNYSPEIKIAALTNPALHVAQYHIAHFAREHEVSKQRIFATGLAHAWYIIKRRVTVDNPVRIIRNTFFDVAKEGSI